MQALSPLWERLARLRGEPIVRELTPYAVRVDAIGAQETDLQRLSDEQLRDESLALIARARGDVDLEDLLVPAFALVREASVRTLGLRPYDVQIIAGIAMHQGNVAEQLTGEGKTLAAVAPVYLNALTGRGVHVLTFNDYLARRDASWMGPIYRFLGLRVGNVQEGMGRAERQAAYGCDVTYLTAKARIPLVIAGATERLAGGPERMAALVQRMRPEHGETDDNDRGVAFSDAGLSLAEEALGVGNLTDADNLPLLGLLNNALHAEVLLTRDVDYIVRRGKVEHVDEFTGRVVDDRHWPDGLQVALEAKEGVRLQREGKILGQITLQHFLDKYPRLAGMTATAQAAADELKHFYDLEVVVVPTHRPCIRQDHPDEVFTHEEAKRAALIREIRSSREAGRPVLVGTASVRESEILSADLRHQGVECEVLNARTDEQEARIVAEAGAPGAITISTNMAGRGTDIRLGGADESQRDAVVAAGGLYVIGTSRHESIRVDNQLRGRAGRQGDPGTSRFFVSLEDELIVRFGVRKLIPAPLIPERRPEPVDNPVIRGEIGRAQRIIEGQNREIRKTLFNYSNLLEEQRKIVQRRRRELLERRAEPDLVARHDPEQHERLVAGADRNAVAEAERRVTLFQIDACWTEHLDEVADVREGIHLMRLGRRDPLGHYQQHITAEFLRLRDRITERVLETMNRIEITPEGLDLDALGLKGPSSTWTYLINDDPFRDALQNALSGGGGFAIGAAFWWPLLMAWHFAKRSKSRHER